MRPELLTISELAQRVGVSVRTIRFWSDEGLIPIARRSAAGYRLYDEQAVARLTLVRSLRELGLGLESVQAILRREQTLAEVASLHVAALDAQIRGLRVQRALLAAAARKGTTVEEVTMIQRFATLTAEEKRQTLERFVSRCFDGLALEGPSARIADSMKHAASELPDDPSDPQIEAWIELLELVSDEAFAARVREMAIAGSPASSATPPVGPDPAEVRELVAPALERGVAPDSEEGRAIVERLLPAQLTSEQRRALRERLATFTDARVERYWQLIGSLQGRPPLPASVPLFAWLIEALTATEREG